MGNHRRGTQGWFNISSSGYPASEYSGMNLKHFAERYTDIWSYGHPAYVGGMGDIYRKVNGSNPNAIAAIYTTPHFVGYDPSGLIPLGGPHRDLVDAFWAAKSLGNIDGASTSPYVHTGSSINFGSRYNWSGYGGAAYMLRFANENVLDFLFGVSQGGNYDGINSLGDHCWFRQLKIDVIPELKWIGHDVFYPALYYGSGYTGTEATELPYAAANWTGSILAYMQAFHERILNPFGLKVIVNLGAAGSTIATMNSFLPYIDGVMLEYGAVNAYDYVNYDTGVFMNQHLAGQIEIGKSVIRSGGIISFRQYYGSIAFKVKSSQSGRTITISNGTITLGGTGGGSFTLEGKTIAQVIADMTAGDVSLTFSVTGCIPYTDAPAILLNNLGSTSIYGTVGVSIYYSNVPRWCYLTTKAIELMCGPADRQALGYHRGDMSSSQLNDSDVYDWYDLLADDDDTDYHLVSGKGNTIFRKRANGWAVVNWTDSPQTITPTDLGHDRDFYPLSYVSGSDPNMIVPGTAGTARASVIIPAHSGELIAENWTI
jgi:hypothetical protein